MAYSEELAERIRDVLAPRPGLSEQKMFGGVAWMIDGNMACGVVGEDLMLRLGPDEAVQALNEPFVGPMDMTGRPMRGFVIVAAEGVADDRDLGGWVDAGADFAASLPPK